MPIVFLNVIFGSGIGSGWYYQHGAHSQMTAHTYRNLQKRSGIEFETRQVVWENTNFMLGQPGYNGCKTGITDAAGPCVSVTYQKDGFYYVIILLNAKSMEARWQEVPQLVEYARHKSGR